MFRKQILAILVILAGVCPVRADLVFDSGYNTFDDNDPYYWEVWVTNDAHLDVLGGAIWKLELIHSATANIYDGDIKWLFVQDNTVVNIHAAGDTLEMFAAGNDSLVYLYAYDVTYHATGGLGGEGWIEGTYYSNDRPFSFSFYNDTTYLHIIIVPVIDAEIEIHPKTLNLQSKGEWLNCRIWLPEDYNVADVEPNSVVLEGEPNDIYAEWIWYNEKQNIMMAKFNRSEVQQMLDDEDIIEIGEAELTVSGELDNGLVFVGTDVIKVIDKGRPIRVNSNSKVEDGIEYYIQTDKRVYKLGEDVDILYRVTNLRDEEWRFNYMPPVLDILVTEKERGNFNPVWFWSWDGTWPAGPKVFQLEPGESVELNGTWPQIDLNGTVEPEDDTQVPPGRYRIGGRIGRSRFNDKIRDFPVTVDITIVP